MKRTLVLVSYNRPIQERTREALAHLTRAGAGYLTQSGCADVALARSVALTGACNALRQLNEQHPSSLNHHTKNRDTLLMVDDDMVFTLEQAQTLVDHSRATGVPASAMYATTLGTLAAARFKTMQHDAGGPQRWLTGLGLIAIPAHALLELERDSETFSFTTDQKKHTAFTWSKAERGEWWSEDFTLCRRLGGVHLLPVGVGHLKTIPLYPDESTIAAIRDGKPLEGEADSTQLERVDHTTLSAEGAK